MKILGISGSPKQTDSTTRIVLDSALQAIKSDTVSVEHIDLSECNFSGCSDCGGCRKQLRCSMDDDFTNSILPILAQKDYGGIIFASPVYFGGVSAQLKAFFDRTLTIRRNGFLFENIVTGAITVGGARNGGQELTAIDIIKFGMIHGMIIVPDAPPTSHFGGAVWSRQPGGVIQESSDTAQAVNLARKVAEIAQKVHEIGNE